MTTDKPVADDALPEPVGYLSLREADLLASGHTAMLRSAKFGPSKLDHDAPLYTADQLREAIAAERAKLKDVHQSYCHSQQALLDSHQRLVKAMRALQDADTIMGHDDAKTEWREQWAHLWAGAGNGEGA